eukprot:TRINITY_DN5094_c0_g2_i1.p1 TRINITY_DN5094_c0_g2~~TRINITY_DN5094_c0_g2_i1.p1  ORF type:complete len:133 (-),score=22.60 TRINITY_DN5094_c0_g2_i1:254-652(-)
MNTTMTGGFCMFVVIFALLCGILPQQCKQHSISCDCWIARAFTTQRFEFCSATKVAIEALGSIRVFGNHRVPAKLSLNRGPVHDADGISECDGDEAVNHWKYSVDVVQSADGGDIMRCCVWLCTSPFPSIEA